MSADRAYFVHGPWLRQIDTVNGRVLGRWRFPNAIREVVPSRFGPVLTVRFDREPGARDAAVHSVLFDPTYGDAPTWSLATPLPYLVSEQEAWGVLKDLSPSLDGWRTPLTAVPAATSVLEELNRRDPTSPWLRVALGKALADAGDPRAHAIFAEAVAIESTDFTELFRIAGTLELLPTPEPQLAASAYERAYTDFVRRYRDPRLMTSLVSLLILYPAAPGPDRVPDAVGRQRMEHLYRLAPVVEGADRAWACLARHWEASGNADAARIWRERAAAAQRESLTLANADVLLTYDRSVLVACGATLAGILLVVALFRKYGLRNLGAASGSERAALLIVAAAGWLSAGAASAYLRVIETSNAQPIHVGEIGGPDDIAFFRDRLPPSPERDLLVAIAHHTSGDLTEAERRYRELPQFAESWNNLGVILARTRRGSDAQPAFAQALKMAPNLAEAVLNTDGLPKTLETELHQQYAPVRKMIAVPTREVFLRATLGDEWTGRYRMMVLGPFRDLPLLRSRAGIPATSVMGLVRPAAFALAIVAAAVFLLALFRRGRPAVERSSPMLERLTPGIAPAWGWAGGPVLLVWCVVISALALWGWQGSPYPLTVQLQPDLVRTFGLLPGDGSLADINPSLFVTGAAAVALFLANWVLVARATPLGAGGAPGGGGEPL